MISIRYSISALLLCSCLPSPAAEDATRILFIGNSYTGQIKKTVINLVQASPFGASTEMEFITPGGKNLEFHLQNETTTRRIAQGNWDFVVLQDQSQTPALFPQRFEDAAIELDKLIDAAGAKTVFYQTWGRRDGDKRNANRFPTFESMQKALSGSYISAAKRCDAILAPVGDTWAQVREEDAELGTALYRDDGSHPSNKGAYLAACVFFAVMFEQSPESVDFRGELPEREAAIILKSVLQTVANETRTSRR